MGSCAEPGLDRRKVEIWDFSQVNKGADGQQAQGVMNDRVWARWGNVVLFLKPFSRKQMGKGFGGEKIN